jgi:rhomboid family GlyGly-CTERM serine protease
LRPSRAALGWVAVAALLGAGALLVHGTPADALDWQRARAWSQPWRWWSAAWVHLSDLHLAANLAGLLLVALLGIAADVTPRSVLAWLLAWPATQLALVVEPALARYGGLSGVLHAAVAIVGVQVVAEGPRLRRGLGALLLAGLAAKVLVEAPWRAALQYPPGWDIAVAPLAHASGAVAGVLAALVLRVWQRGPAAKQR